MQIENGKIVKFIQSFSSPLSGQWGRLEKTVRFPESLPKLLVDSLNGKTQQDKIRIPLDYLEKMVYDEALVIKVKRDKLSGAPEIQSGMVYQASFANRQLQGVVKEIHDDVIVMDCNHPMAGEKNAISDILVLEVRNATKEEAEEDFKPISKAV